MPADYEASRQRDRRFARRTLFALLALDGLLFGLFGALALSTGALEPLKALTSVNLAVLVVALLVWISGKVVR